MSTAPLYPSLLDGIALAACLVVLWLLYLALGLWERRVELVERRRARMVARIVNYYAPGFGAGGEERQ